MAKSRRKEGVRPPLRPISREEEAETRNTIREKQKVLPRNQLKICDVFSILRRDIRNYCLCFSRWHRWRRRSEGEASLIFISIYQWWRIQPSDLSISHRTQTFANFTLFPRDLKRFYQWLGRKSLFTFLPSSSSSSYSQYSLVFLQMLTLRHFARRKRRSETFYPRSLKVVDLYRCGVGVRFQQSLFNPFLQIFLKSVSHGITMIGGVRWNRWRMKI